MSNPAAVAIEWIAPVLIEPTPVSPAPRDRLYFIRWILSGLTLMMRRCFKGAP